MADEARPTPDWRRALDGIWTALEHIAEAVDAGALHGAPTTTGPVESLASPQSLARELGHDDQGVRVRGFLRAPDDGGGLFAHRPNAHWLLDETAADRVRRRFRPSA